MKFDPNQYRETFFAEAAEHLQALEAALLRLDAGSDPDAVDEAFRSAHTIKGGADVVGLDSVARLTHTLETLLARFRSAAGVVPRAALDLLMEGRDGLVALLDAEHAGATPPDTSALLARLAAAPVQAAPVPPVPARKYRVRILPEPDAFKLGIDPLPLLREVSDQGTVSNVAVDVSRLPPLERLDPERCYLSWSLDLEASRALSGGDDLFGFLPSGVTVELTAECPGGPPAGVPASVPSAPRGPELANVSYAERQALAPDPVRFAAFLVRRGAISAEAALAALEAHRDERPSLAAAAVECGLLDTRRLFELVAAALPGEGFAVTAVRCGALLAADLGALLLHQEQRALTFPQCLLRAGALAPEVVDSELAAYREKAERSPDPGRSYSEALPAPVALPANPGASMLEENGAMLPEFCSEADEHLEAVDRHLLTLDARPTDAEALNAVYRAFHSIKGVASMLGLAEIQTLAHEAENLLNLARDGKVLLRGKPLDLVFASNDSLKRQIAEVRRWPSVGGRLTSDAAVPALLADLRAAVGGPPVSRPPRAVPAPAAAPAVRDRSALAPVPPAPPEREAEPPAPVEHAPARPDAHSRRAEKETVRVDKDRLDKLVNTIGELVIAQAMAQQEFDAHAPGVASVALPELAKTSRDLQELSLSLRMVPMQATFQKMARLVRDLSRKLNKPVDLELHGEETELDKTVVDQLGDPLMHMVRNGLDHGLEEPAERVAAGKPATGRLALRAYHQGGNIYIELTDDGRGLDRDRILRKAVEKGIVREGQRLTDAEVYALIFEPGFSTAKAVTDVSGRGVGMDVVRRNVEALQGNILIRTQLGKGTTFTVRLPLTLAIMDGLMVGLGGDVYVIPLLSVVESFRPRRDEVRTAAARGTVISMRGEVYPLLRLHELLGRPAEVTDPCRGLVVLVEDQGKKFALLVDELLGQMQAVVKSLDENYQRIDGLAGATILGDGRVAMILDIHGLTQLHTQFGGRSAPELIGELV